MYIVVQKKFILAVLFCVLHLIAICVLFCGYHHLIKETNLQKNIEFQAVKGYSYCEVRDSTLAEYNHKYKCDFKNVALFKGTLVVTFINSAWISLARNWVCSASKVGLQPNILLVSLQPGVCKQMVGIACYEYPNASIVGTTFGKKDYQELVTKRTELLLKLLSCGRNIVFVDADIVFIKNPIPYLEKKAMNKDILFQADSIAVPLVDYIIPYFLHYVCGGFIYMKPNLATKRLWLSVLQYQKHYFWNDQGGLNVCIRHHTQQVAWSTLDSDRFPNGQQYFVYSQRSNRNLIVHANHLMGLEKVMRLISAGIWCDYGTAVEVCRNPDYVNKCKLRSPTDNNQWCQDFTQVCRHQYNVIV